MHAAAYRSIVVALRGARPVTPKRIRRGGNTGSFDLVARTDRQLVASAPGDAQQRLARAKRGVASDHY